MLLSVIIPVYNKEKTLPAALNSVLAVKSDDIELLLVDDGSTDGSGSICDDYALKDKRVKVFHKKNGGVSSARNLGIDNAKGKYVYFCDADDMIVSKTLEDGLDLIKKVDADLFVFDFQYNLPDGKKSKSSFVLPQNILIKRNEIVEKMITPLVLKGATDLAPLWHKIFSLSTVKNNGVRFDEKVHKGEDWRFILDYLDESKTAYYEPKILYFYNLDGSQVESKYKREAGIHLLGSPIRKVKLIEKYNIGASETDKFLIYKNILDEVIYTVKYCKDKKEVKSILNDENVKNTAKIVLKKKKNDFYSAEISRKYKIYAKLIRLKCKFLLKLISK